MSRHQTLEVPTNSPQAFVDITPQLNQAVKQQGIATGMCHIFIPHTTCGVTVNENWDPDVERDMLHTLERLIPGQGDYRHAEGNSHAHIKASLMGSSLALMIENGKVLLGKWQGVFLCEFDGPRTRRVMVRITA